MTNTSIYELLLSQQRQIRHLTLHLEALKRMMFEHRPPFVQAFEQQVGAIEASGLPKEMDEKIRQLESAIQHSRKS